MTALGLKMLIDIDGYRGLGKLTRRRTKSLVMTRAASRYNTLVSRTKLRSAPRPH